MRALESLANAVRVDRERNGYLSEVAVLYGDASSAAVFTPEEVLDIAARFSPFFRFSYTFFGENTGTAKGHNRLAEGTSAELLMIMNPDVLVCPRLFDGMVAPFLDEESNVGLTEARQTPVEHPKEYDRKTLDTDWAATACAMFPTSVFRALNGFDSRTFFLYCDDVDFSLRVRLLGKRVMYRPDCVVFHAKRLSSTGKWQPTAAEVYYSAEASLLMAYKWSADDRFKMLYRTFSESDNEVLQKVVRRFNEMRDGGLLPEKIDKDNKILHYVGDNYTKHRYAL